MFDNFGVMPDTIKNQDLEFFMMVRMADEAEEIPLTYAETVDFT